MNVRSLALVLVLVPGPLLAGGPAGTLDPSFGAGGQIMTDFTPAGGGPNGSARSLLLQPDGRIVVVGVTRLAPFGKLALARYLADGRPDPAFGTAGVTVSPLDQFYALDAVGALQPDGRLMTAGPVVGGPAAPDWKLQIVRFLADGTQDTSFGGGRVLDDFGYDRVEANAIVVQASGDVVVGGSGTFSSSVFDEGVLVRYHADGTRDATFTPPLPQHVRVQDVVLQPDQKILVSTSGLLRLLPDGAADPSFGTGGLVSGAGGRLALQPDGRIIAAGYSPANRISLVRYESDGSLDTSFGSGGYAEDVAGIPALQPDGKIVVGSATKLPGGSPLNFALSRLTADGQPDPSFNGGVPVRTDVAGASDLITALAVQPDGRIVAAGSGQQSIVSSSVAVARYLGGTCGDGATDGGEECDGGPGCDASCCLADSDGDGVCDANDPCTGTPVAASVGKLSIRGLYLGLDSLPQNNTLSLQVDVVLPAPITPPLDPLVKGVRLVLRDPTRTLVDVTVGGGAYTRPPGVGWTVRTTPHLARWQYTDRTLRTPAGINKVSVEDRSATSPGLVRIKVTGRNFHYRAFVDDLPLSVLVVLDAPSAESGQCAEATFPGPPPTPTCVLDASRGILSCK